MAPVAHRPVLWARGGRQSGSAERQEVRAMWCEVCDQFDAQAVHLPNGLVVCQHCKAYELGE